MREAPRPLTLLDYAERISENLEESRCSMERESGLSITLNEKVTCILLRKAAPHLAQDQMRCLARPASCLRDDAWNADFTQRAFERRPVPVRTVRRGFIRALQKLEQRLVRRLSGSHDLIGQDELS
jgi:hypothetical protein